MSAGLLRALAVKYRDVIKPMEPYIPQILDSSIVEEGENANGQYVRWANGLQLCTRAVDVSDLEFTTEGNVVSAVVVGDHAFPAEFSYVLYASGAIAGGSPTTLRNRTWFGKTAYGRASRTYDTAAWGSFTMYSSSGFTAESGRVYLFALGWWE